MCCQFLEAYNDWIDNGLTYLSGYYSIVRNKLFCELITKRIIDMNTKPVLENSTTDELSKDQLCEHPELYRVGKGERVYGRAIQKRDLTVLEI